mmetsp:Transcript_6317/g.20108  ORF Transcript_6317/g.20108 Transcript_6317/m.20108 type:complete len:206 (-) Transcript_6317:107-724(-)
MLVCGSGARSLASVLATSSNGMPCSRRMASANAGKDSSSSSASTHALSPLGHGCIRAASSRNRSASACASSTHDGERKPRTMPMPRLASSNPSNADAGSWFQRAAMCSGVATTAAPRRTLSDCARRKYSRTQRTTSRANASFRICGRRKRSVAASITSPCAAPFLFTLASTSSARSWTRGMISSSCAAKSSRESSSWKLLGNRDR